ncbi:MAG: site-specific DNA-methyltransferase [Smithella sp.]
MIERNKIYNEDNGTGMQRIESGSVDVILTDPPYLYLKGQKLDRPFDEQLFFVECRRILKDSGFIVMFGRGESFYRWNTILANLKFTFKEEIIWDKSYVTSPVTPISRKHETISIFAKKLGKINTTRVPYLEVKENDISSIAQDLKRIKSSLHNNKTLEELNLYLETKQVEYKEDRKSGHNTTVQSLIKNGDRAVITMQLLDNGLKEKSIITVKRDHYSIIHPTQKPVRLLERLLALVSKPGDLVCDPFSGSGSTAIACINTHRNFVGFEIDYEYYDASIERINEAIRVPKQKTLFTKY